MALSRYEKTGLTISLVVITLVATLFPMLILAAESEYNYKIKKNDWEYTFRHSEGGKHIEIGNKIGPIEVTYKQNNWKVTPFIERKSTEGYNYRITVTGIHWEAKFN
jgi:hypothetical protein